MNMRRISQMMSGKPTNTAARMRSRLVVLMPNACATPPNAPDTVPVMAPPTLPTTVPVTACVVPLTVWLSWLS